MNEKQQGQQEQEQEQVQHHLLADVMADNCLDTPPVWLRGLWRRRMIEQHFRDPKSIDGDGGDVLYLQMIAEGGATSPSQVSPTLPIPEECCDSLRFLLPTENKVGTLHWCIDARLPRRLVKHKQANVDDICTRELAQYSHAQLRLLLEQEAFAGVATFHPVPSRDGVHEQAQSNASESCASSTPSPVMIAWHALLESTDMKDRGNSADNSVEPRQHNNAFLTLLATIAGTHVTEDVGIAIPHPPEGSDTSLPDVDPSAWREVDVDTRGAVLTEEWRRVMATSIRCDTEERCDLSEQQPSQQRPHQQQQQQQQQHQQQRVFAQFDLVSSRGVISLLLVIGMRFAYVRRDTWTNRNDDLEGGGEKEKEEEEEVMVEEEGEANTFGHCASCEGLSNGDLAASESASRRCLLARLREEYAFGVVEPGHHSTATNNVQACGGEGGGGGGGGGDGDGDGGGGGDGGDGDYLSGCVYRLITSTLPFREGQILSHQEIPTLSWSV